MKELIQKLLGKPTTTSVEQPKGIRVMSTVKPIEPRNFNDWANFIKKELITTQDLNNVK